LYPSYRIYLFLLSALFNFRPKRKKEQHIMDLRHYVCKENSDTFDSCTQFIVCYSTQNHNLHWNRYTYYWSKQYQTKIHQNNLTSASVDPTPSHFIKCTPNMVLKCMRMLLRISEITFTFFLKLFTIEK
jgi:hypothetical protein